MPNFVSFVASITELARGEKMHNQSLTHPTYLMPHKPKHLCFGIHWKGVDNGGVGEGMPKSDDPGVWSFVLTPILSVAASGEVQWTAITFSECKNG